MPNDPASRVFLAHAALYAAVTLVLAGINLWLAPQNLWFVWVVLGWGIGVAAHGLALFLRTTRRRERIFIDRNARGFTVHAFAYAAVVVLLLIVNLTRTPETMWWYWVALGWGAGLAFHAGCAFFKKHPHHAHHVDVEEDEKPRRRARRARRAKP